MSSDEESGFTTSSGEEGPGNSATPSGNSSPVPKKNHAETSNAQASKPSTQNNGNYFATRICIQC